MSSPNIKIESLAPHDIADAGAGGKNDSILNDGDVKKGGWTDTIMRTFAELRPGSRNVCGTKSQLLRLNSGRGLHMFSMT
jgi:hypothetical protein